MTTDEIEQHFGSTEKVAEFFGITSEAVYQWRNRPGRLIHRREDLAVGIEPEWKVDKQPAWLVAAIKKTITELPGGYSEAAEWLGVTENALFNRLRTDGDQIFPLGWAMVLQRAGGSNHIANAIARHSNGVFVPLADVEEIENGDINQRLMESVEWIGRQSQYVRKATADGVIDAQERAQIEENSYQVMAKWQEHLTLLFRVFCAPEKSDARECAAPGVVADKSCMEK